MGNLGRFTTIKKEGENCDFRSHKSFLSSLRSVTYFVNLQGKYAEALRCMERALVLRQHFFGEGSDEVGSASCHAPLILTVNSLLQAVI